MKKKRFGLVGVAVFLAAVLIFVSLPERVIVTGEGSLSLESHIALAAQQGVMGTSEPVPQQIED